LVIACATGTKYLTQKLGVSVPIINNKGFTLSIKSSFGVNYSFKAHPKKHNRMCDNIIMAYDKTFITRLHDEYRISSFGQIRGNNKSIESEYIDYMENEFKEVHEQALLI
jgi:hypothetical protein